MGALDVVAVPGYQGMWARRAVVEAWIAAGKPKLLWAGRTYEEQKRLYLGWKNKKPGYNAADNPDANTRQPHVRGMALDLAVYDAATVKRMLKAGFTRPIWVKNGYSQDEPWHFELSAYVAKIRDIPKVTAAAASSGAKPFEPAKPAEPTTVPEEDSMGFYWYVTSAGTHYWFSYATGKSRPVSKLEWEMLRGVESGADPRVDLPPIHRVGPGFADKYLIPTVA